MMRALVVASGCHAIAIPDNGSCAGNLLLSAQVVTLCDCSAGGLGGFVQKYIVWDERILSISHYTYDFTMSPDPEIQLPYYR